MHVEIFVVCIAGPVAMVQPVRPWSYQFLREKKLCHLNSNLHVHILPQPAKCGWG